MRAATNPAAAKSSSTSNASSWLSMGWVLICGIGWPRKHGFVEPETGHALHPGQVFVELDRLADIAVGVVAVGGLHLLLGARGGEDHHRDAAQPRVGLDLAQ